jgi:hypothetical protein
MLAASVIAVFLIPASFYLVEKLGTRKMAGAKALSTIDFRKENNPP